MYTWNTTIEDTSSLLDFRPYSEGTISGGWASYFQDLGFWHGSPGLDSQSKDSVHITNFAGASVTLQFEGTAIYLYGSQNCSYTVTLDSQPATIPFKSSLPDGMLFYKEDMTSITHTITLTANPSTGEQLAFDKAVFTNLGVNASGINPVQIDGLNQTVLHYDGKWTNQSSYNVPSDSSPAPYMSTSDPGDTVSMTFRGGAAVSINGPRNWGHWTYNVSLDGVSSVYNASTRWLVGDALLFYQSNLDPDQTHTIELANVGSPNNKLSVNYFTVYTPDSTALDTSPSNSSSPSAGSPTQEPSSKPHSKTNVGVIVGPIIAALAVLASLLILFIWLRRRRQQHTLATSANPLYPPETSQTQSTTALGGVGAISAFPRNERPDIWVKGMEPGQPVPPIMEIQAVPPVVPRQGKRRHHHANSSPASRSRSASRAGIPPAHSIQPSASSSSLRSPPSIPPPSNSQHDSEAPSVPPPPIAPIASTDTSSQHSAPHSSSRHTRGDSSTTRTQSPMPQLNVDHIIELIAQRIDRDPSRGRGAFVGGHVEHDPDVPPPQYAV